MLKWAIGLLLLGNLGYFLWSQGHLGALGAAPSEQREPERLQSQVRPEVLRLLNGPNGAEAAPPDAGSPATPTASPTSPALADAAPTAGPLPAVPASATPAREAPGTAC